MKHIGLFEGIGGFSLAAEWAGCETIAWCEINPFCQKILSYHFPKANKHHDIKTTDFTIYRGQCDILTGGFPCQPYSLAGKRKGKEDDRHLWPEMLRAIREVQPTWIVGENVAGLLNWNGGMVLNEIKTDLEDSGFEVFPPCILPACGKNAPHRRDRLWIVAYSRHNSERKATHSSTNEGSEFTAIHTEGQGGKSKAVFNNGLCDLHRDAADTDNQGLQGGKKHRGIKEIRQNGNEQLTGCVSPDWENFPTQSPVCSGNDGISYGLDGITFPKWRNESIKAYGNAIVPQVAYQIFKAINEMTNNSLNCSTIQLAK